MYRKRGAGRPGTQRHEKGLIFIIVQAWLARTTGAGQTVCDAGRRMQRHEKGLTFIRV